MSLKDIKKRKQLADNKKLEKKAKIKIKRQKQDIKFFV